MNRFLHDSYGLLHIIAIAGAVVLLYKLSV
jgi:hypothetical protein